MNEIIYHSLFIRIAINLIAIQNAMEEKKSITPYYENFCSVVKEYMCHAYRDGLPHPKTKGEYFSFFQKSLKDYKIDSLFSLTNKEDIPLIHPDTGKVHPFWVRLLEERQAYESEEAENFNQIVQLIKDLPIDKREAAQLALMDLRHRLSNREQPTIIEGLDRLKILEVFNIDKELSWRVSQFFYELPIHMSDLLLCPHCGGILVNKDNEIKCVHWRCQREIRSILNQNALFEEVSLDRKKYYTFTDWVKRFIRIPGIEEQRIGERSLSRILNHTNEAELIYNPDNDRVDLLINVYGEPLIQGDVKDFENPYYLAEQLNKKYSIKKCGPLSKVFIIIPDDTITHFTESKDYMEIINAELTNEKKEYLEIVSEDKWLRCIGEVWNEFKFNSEDE